MDSVWVSKMSPDPSAVHVLRPINAREGRKPNGKLKPVSKSFVPGKGFKPASKLGKGKLQRLANAPGNRYHSRGLDKSQEKVMANHSANAEIRDNMRAGAERIGGDSKATHYSRPMLPGMGGVAFGRGGKRTPNELYINSQTSGNPAFDKKIVRHEQAHAETKRSSWRMSQVLADPKKHTREEARADFKAGIKYREAGKVKRTERTFYQHTAAKTLPMSGYQPSAAGMLHPKSYRQTQDKMGGEKRKYIAPSTPLKITGAVAGGATYGSLKLKDRKKKKA